VIGELASRVDDVITLQPLTQAARLQIVQQQLAAAAAAARHQGILLEYDDVAAAWFGQQGFSASAGARLLSQLIRRHVMVPLAAAIMQAADEPSSSSNVSGSYFGKLSAENGSSGRAGCGNVVAPMTLNAQSSDGSSGVWALAGVSLKPQSQLGLSGARTSSSAHGGVPAGDGAVPQLHFVQL
jgi:hypothetical protein